jgi:hypothetical protein
VQGFPFFPVGRGRGEGELREKMEVEILEKIPSAEEYNEVRESVGWGIYEKGINQFALDTWAFNKNAQRFSKS